MSAGPCRCKWDDPSKFTTDGYKITCKTCHKSWPHSYFRTKELHEMIHTKDKIIEKLKELYYYSDLRNYKFRKGNSVDHWCGSHYITKFNVVNSLISEDSGKKAREVKKEVELLERELKQCQNT